MRKTTEAGNDIEVNIRHLERRIALLSGQAIALIGAQPALQTAFALFVSVPGIAAHTAVQRLPELFVLPETMTVRQWVAHAGLDPRAHQSGTFVDKPAASRKSATPTSAARSTCPLSWPCSTIATCAPS